MKYGFGHFSTTKLNKGLKTNDFFKPGDITKDKIEECKEFGYVCTDCRRYL